MGFLEKDKHRSLISIVSSYSIAISEMRVMETMFNSMGYVCAHTMIL